MVERGAKVKLYVVNDAKRKTLEPLIYLHVKKDSKVMSDEWWAYTNLNRNYRHGVVKHKIKEYVRGNIHTNSIEGLWNLLKNGIKTTHVRPTRKFLQNYCDEFEFKYNLRNQSVHLKFNKVLSQAKFRIRNYELAE